MIDIAVIWSACLASFVLGWWAHAQVAKRRLRTFSADRVAEHLAGRTTVDLTSDEGEGEHDRRHPEGSGRVKSGFAPPAR